MFFLLLECVDVTLDIGRAIFSGTHADSAKEYVRRILEVASPDPARDDDLRAAFAQLTLINNLRNAVVHWGAHLHVDGIRYAADTLKALTAEKRRVYLATPATLRAATKDLIKITEHVRAYNGGRGALPLAPNKRLLDASWQYKPQAEHKPGPISWTKRPSR